VANRPEVIAFRQWLLAELAAAHQQPHAANDASPPRSTAA
jgi:hypothetical protein